METLGHAIFSCMAPFFVSYHLMPRGRKNHLNMATFCICRQRELNPGHQHSKQMRYPLHHCPSADNACYVNIIMCVHEACFHSQAEQLCIVEELHLLDGPLKDTLLKDKDRERKRGRHSFKLYLFAANVLSNQSPVTLELPPAVDDVQFITLSMQTPLHICRYVYNRYEW